MRSIYTLSSPINDLERNERIFSGALIIFKNIPSMHSLCNFADELSRKFFHPHEPIEAHRSIPWSSYTAITTKLQKEFTNNETAKKFFRSALSECGVEIDKTYWDWFPLRIQPGNAEKTSLATTGYGAHRDSWFGNIQAQNNWWGPIYPICPERTMFMYPTYFDKSVDNDSEGWDLQDFRNARAAARAQNLSDKDVEESYRFIRVRKQLDNNLAVRVIPEPGDLFCFSGAHLHASIPNTTPMARFSTEVRTIRLDCVINGLGAPKVDGQSTGNSYEDFFRISDGENILSQLPVNMRSKNLLAIT